MTDIFEEVDESLRQDTALKWWKRMLPYLIITIVLVIGAVAMLEFMKSQREAAIDRDAKVFDTANTALEKNDLAGARMAFSQLGEGKGGFAALSNHMLARVEQQLTNDPATIDKAYAAAAATDKGLLGDLAILKAAYAKADAASLADLEATVAPLIKKGGYAASLARELVAAKVLATGDTERARTEYQALTLELEAPQGMAQRAQQALLTLPPKPAATPAAAPATTTTPAPTTPTTAPAKPQ